MCNIMINVRSVHLCTAFSVSAARRQQPQVPSCLAVLAPAALRARRRGRARAALGPWVMIIGWLMLFHGKWVIGDGMLLLMIFNTC